MKTLILVVSGALLFPFPVRAQPQAQAKAKARAQAGSAEIPDVLVTVDGVPIRREDVAKRIWTQYASAGLNQLVDEMAVDKALSAWRAKQTKRDEDSITAEVEARLKRIRSQFKDEEAFRRSLESNGAQLAGLEADLRGQLERERLIVSAKHLSVAPAEIREFYDANKGKLGGPPTFHLRHILVADEKGANGLLIALKAGADFAKLAEKTSLDAATKEKGGDLGFVLLNSVPADVQKELAGLKAGEMSEAVRLPDGFHVFKVEERLEPTDPPFEAAKKDITDAILDHKMSLAWPAYLAELRAAMKIVPSPGVTMAPPAAASAAQP